MKPYPILITITLLIAFSTGYADWPVLSVKSSGDAAVTTVLTQAQWIEIDHDGQVLDVYAEPGGEEGMWVKLLDVDEGIGWDTFNAYTQENIFTIPNVTPSQNANGYFWEISYDGTYQIIREARFSPAVSGLRGTVYSMHENISAMGIMSFFVEDTGSVISFTDSWAKANDGYAFSYASSTAASAAPFYKKKMNIGWCTFETDTALVGVRYRQVAFDGSKHDGYTFSAAKKQFPIRQLWAFVRYP